MLIITKIREQFHAMHLIVLLLLMILVAVLLDLGIDYQHKMKREKIRILEECVQVKQNTIDNKENAKDIRELERKKK